MQMAALLVGTNHTLCGHAYQRVPPAVDKTTGATVAAAVTANNQNLQSYLAQWQSGGTCDHSTVLRLVLRSTYTCVGTPRQESQVSALPLHRLEQRP